MKNYHEVKECGPCFVNGYFHPVLLFPDPLSKALVSDSDKCCLLSIEYMRALVLNPGFLFLMISYAGVLRALFEVLSTQGLSFPVSTVI